jgi:hypothetical protein
MFTAETVSAEGKIRKRYRHDQVKTPLEALVLFAEEGVVKFKPGRSVEASGEHKSTDRSGCG